MIRRAIKKDSERILELLYQVHDVHAKGRPDIFKEGVRKFNKEEVEKLIDDDENPIYVYDEEVIKGYAFVEWKTEVESSSRYGRKELFIEDLCVDKKYRRAGIATSLFRFLEELAKKENCDYLTLNVWALNKDAIKFYESIGMSPLRTIMEKKI